MGSKGIEQSPLAGPSNPVKPLAIYETALKRELQQLVQQREQRRLVHNETEPLSQAELSQLVDESLARLPAYEGAGEVVKTILEKALERVVLELPELLSEPWQDDDAHLLIYHDMLDILLAFEERQQLDITLIAVTIETLLETQTVQVVERMFTYLETRVDRLTRGMVPGRGKALVILRLLNDLLRRLSKSTHTVFCGRILLFLSSIFPLGERSGVNLRGEYNKENTTTFEEPEEPMQVAEEPAGDEEEDDAMVEQSLLPTKAEKTGSPSKPSITVEAPEDGEEVEEAGTETEEAAKAAESKISPVKKADDRRSANEPEFYALFWSMQRYFSDPPSLFQRDVHASLPAVLSTYAASFPTIPPVSKDGKIAATPMAAGTSNLTLLREGVAKLLDVFREASKEEKALQGAAKDGAARLSNVKKQDTAVTPSTNEDDVRRLFFYPKFLTSKALLDLEVADSSFRKQVMVQCLILFRFLHACTDAAKLKLQGSLSHPNRSVLLTAFKLSDADAKWVSDLEARTYMEISRTPIDGEYTVKTVKLILQNERNWSRWKANSCPDIEKPPATAEESVEAQNLRKKLEAPAPGFPYKAGTPALSRLWATQGKNGDAEERVSKNLPRFFEAVKKQNEQVKMREYEMEEEGRTTPAEKAQDTELRALQERKASLAWRTLRVASAGQLHLFGKIGLSVYNIEKLMDAMDSKRSTPNPSTQPPVKIEPETTQEAATNGSADTTTAEAPAVETTLPTETESGGTKRALEDIDMEVDEDTAKKVKIEVVASDTLAEA